MLIAGSPGRGTVRDRRGPYGAAEQRADQQGQSGHHRGHHRAAAQHPAPQVGHLDAGAEPPPGLAGQPGVHGVDRGARDDQRAPGGEVDDVGGVVGGDGAPADGHQQRGGEQRADRRGDPLPQAADGQDADDDLEEGDGQTGADGVRDGEVAQRYGQRPGVERQQPLDHRAPLAAVEVDGVAELAHAGVDGDQAEEDRAAAAGRRRGSSGGRGSTRAARCRPRRLPRRSRPRTSSRASSNRSSS